MNEKKYTLREIEDLIKNDKNIHRGILKSIRRSVVSFKKDHPDSDLNDANSWPSISKRACGQIATCFHNEWQRRYKKKDS